MNDGADSGADDVTDPESDSENENDAPGADGPDLLTPGGQLWIAAGPGYRLAMYLHKVGPQLLWEQAHFTGNLAFTRDADVLRPAARRPFHFFLPMFSVSMLADIIWLTNIRLAASACRISVNWLLIFFGNNLCMSIF